MPHINKDKSVRSTTCIQLDLETLGSRLIMPKTFPNDKPRILHHESGHHIPESQPSTHSTREELLYVRIATKVNAGVVWFACFFFETEGQQANVKAHEAIDHPESFLSSREKISQLGIEPANSSLRFGHRSTNLICFSCSKILPTKIYATELVSQWQLHDGASTKTEWEIGPPVM